MTLDEQIKALYATLKAMAAKDMTDAQYEVFCCLDNLLGE